MLPIRPAPGEFELRGSSTLIRHVVVVSPGTCVVVLGGEIDAQSCGRIPAEVERLCRLGCQEVRIDLGAVSFIDAATVGALVRSRARARASGADVTVANATGLPLRVLRLVGMDRSLLRGDGRRG